MLLKMSVYTQMQTYTIFFIHLSTDIHLGCFHSLTTVSNSAITHGTPDIDWSSLISLPLDIYQEVGKVFNAQLS